MVPVMNPQLDGHQAREQGKNTGREVTISRFGAYREVCKFPCAVC